MPFDPIVVPSFGKGLNFTKNPAGLDPAEWTWADGWVAKDGYAEVLPKYIRNLDTSWLPATSNPIGIVQNPFDPSSAAILAAVNTSTGAVAVFRAPAPAGGGGVAVSIPWSGADTGGGAQAPKGDAFGLLGSAFLNGFLVLSFGANLVGGTGSNSLVQLSDTTGYTTIKPTKALRAKYLAAFASHCLAVGTGFAGDEAGARQILVSDVNSTTVWDEAVSNSADTITLSDASMRITAAVRHSSNSFVVFSWERAYVLQSTGSIPPFMVETGPLGGCRSIVSSALIDGHRGAGGYVGETPYGAIYRGADDFYIFGSSTGFAHNVIDFYRLGEATGSLTLNPCPQFHWHGDRGVLLFPRQVPNAGNTRDMLIFDPPTGAWSRKVLPASTGGQPVSRHAVLLDSLAGQTTGGRRRHWLQMLDGDVWVEDDAEGASGGEFVDTKDFSLGNPTVSADWALCKVDWEPLTNATTDAIDILAYARNDLSPGLLGTDGANTDFSSQFVLQGTLTGGQHEQTLRVQGKYLRLRFRQKSGRVRVRGFTLQGRAAGERPT